MKTKRLLSMLLVGAMAASMAACGGGSSAPEGGSSAEGGAQAGASEGGNKLTVYAWDKGFNIPALEAAAADYKANVDAEFELEIIEQSQSSDVEQAITLAASANDYSTLPDIVLFQDHGFKKYLVDCPGAWVPVEGADINWDDFGAEKLSYSISDGQHYGVPLDNGTVIFAYRVDILEECGYTMDDVTGITWDRFIEIGEEVFNKTGKYLLSMDGSGNDLPYMMLQAEGVSQFKDGVPVIGSDETVAQVVDVITRMIQKNVLYLANDWGAYCDQSIQGDMVAGVMNGNWIIPTIQKVTANSGKWEITSMPTLTGKEGYASNGGSSFYITANCKNVDLAKKFLAYTFGGSSATYDEALRKGGVVTTCISAGKSDVYMEGIEFFNNTPIYAQIVEMGANVPIVEQSDYHYPIREKLSAAIINIKDGADLKEQLQQAEADTKFAMGIN